MASVGQGSSSAGNSAGDLATRKLNEEVEGMRDEMAKMGNMVLVLNPTLMIRSLARKVRLDKESKRRRAEFF